MSLFSRTVANGLAGGKSPSGDTAFFGWPFIGVTMDLETFYYVVTLIDLPLSFVFDLLVLPIDLIARAPSSGSPASSLDRAPSTPQVEPKRGGPAEPAHDPPSRD
jgi:hypothetical protein